MEQLSRIEDATHTDDGDSSRERFNELNQSKDSSAQAGFTVLKNGQIAINKQIVVKTR